MDEVTNTENKGLLPSIGKVQLNYPEAYDQMIEGIAIINFEWICLYANQAIEKQTLINLNQMVGHKILEIAPEFEKSLFFKAFRSVMNKRNPINIESDYKFNDGSVHWFQLKVTPIPEGIFIRSLELTKRKLAENSIEQLQVLAEFQAAELNAIIESIPDAVIVGDFDGIKLCNSKALGLLGVSSLDDMNVNLSLLADKFNSRHPETNLPMKLEELPLVRALKGETVEDEVLITNAQSGKDVNIRVACAPVIFNGKVISAVAVESNITEKKRMDKLIRTSLVEKEVLLKEIYHRTKNNMQVISSLLSLKSASLVDREMITILNDMKNRIRTIANLHDMLNASTDYIQVDLGAYITSIVNLLTESFIANIKRISIKLDLEELKVHINTAIPCGLIVNELITNSLKYAFPGDREGEILIKLSKPDGSIELNISDNGVGFDPEESSGDKMGLQMFHLLAESQLEAETKLHVNNGVTINLRFKDSKNADLT